MNRTESAIFLREVFDFSEVPRTAVITGSGQDGALSFLTERQELPFSAIPYFTSSTVPGHGSKLIVGRCGGRQVLALCGRRHRYEGCTMEEIVYPVRTLAALGVREVVLLNAAGGINLSFLPGDLMLITDHINLSGQSPLIGPNDDQLGPRFPDMSEAYSAELIRRMHLAAARCALRLREGVYAYTPGPQFETPAEIRYMRTIGADAVGMSTVPEVIAARHAGLLVAGVSGITNSAAGIAGPLSHEEVLRAGERMNVKLSRLLERFLES